MTKKTQIPPDFQVSDDVRRYASEKWSLLYLPDVYLQDFVDVFTQNGKKHIDWDATFKVFLRGESPSGRFYKPWVWEGRCSAAKRYKQPRTESHPPPRPRGTWQPTDTGREALKHIRELLEKSRD